jgi:hypothetical protein
MKINSKQATNDAPETPVDDFDRLSYDELEAVAHAVRDAWHVRNLERKAARATAQAEPTGTPVSERDPLPELKVFVGHQLRPVEKPHIGKALVAAARLAAMGIILLADPEGYQTDIEDIVARAISMAGTMYAVQKHLNGMRRLSYAK